ncbi:MAG TPA: MFS transporter [Microthrixaceae bacterium]|nr:MFS transporter [Microthrixaceae bacterium]MCB9402320.1 MFS transporter [Microthrixaceae bacterium]MCO5305403.1 MFS transporter [Microthrixaceae bacterium]HMX65617.1 MFS transporter [Microthrixaceae bacterium]HNE35277.1 MFS transporter [Microthrixaceae bacterium]
MKKTALIALAIAQFVMVLDQSVMNVSISQLVADFDTTVPTIQAVITLYCLVMAMLMLTGGKIGDIIGRRRAFTIGLVIYAVGSATTAVAPTVAVLALGWSVLEGIGAALVLPAMAALIAGNFEGTARKQAYAVIGGVAGAGIAVGPIVGGWATTELSWRVVFAGEVVLVAIILALTPKVADALRDGPAPRLDVVGAVLSATGIGAVVLGILQSSTWGFLAPKDSPVEPLGFSLAVFVVIGGALLLWAFVVWSRHREAQGRDPLVHLRLFEVLPLRSGLVGLLTQNLVLMGVFFVVPLYLQLVIGLDALDTGLRMLPISITMFLFSAIGSRLSARVSVRTIVRTGLVVSTLAIVVLIATVDAQLNDLGFAVSMALLGVGMGLIVSQLGNVVQSSVDASGRGEAGGLQYTGQQLGSSVGVALIGAIVLAGLTNVFVRTIDADERIAPEVAQQVSTAAGNGVDFVASDDLAAAATDAGIDEQSADALVDDYEQAQLRALKTGLLVTGVLALLSLMSTRHLPATVTAGDDDREDDPVGDDPVGADPL